MDAFVAARVEEYSVDATRKGGDGAKAFGGGECLGFGGFTAEDVRRKDANETRGGGGGGEGEDASIARRRRRVQEF